LSNTNINFILYFIIGGVVVSTVAYFGSQGKGLLAAFIALFPAATVLTFLMIYLETGASATISYAKGLLILTPAWILYLLALIFTMPKLGFYKALILGITLYVIVSLITASLMK